MEVFERVFQVNTFGAVRMTRWLLPSLRLYSKKNPSLPPSRIVMITSAAGRVAAPGMSVYSGSKFALEAISDSLRREMKLNGHRVDVAVVEPFFAQTPILSFFDWSVEKHVRVFKEGIIPELREQVIEDFGGEEFVRWSIEQESTFRPPMMNPQKVVDVITDQVKAVATTDRSVVGSLMEKTVFWTAENISERWITLALDLGAQQKQKQWQLELSSRERTGC
ncbi:hypothetical protein HDU93_003467 [Gonapodya sp. JEL0774]|nr:hypothetical protein HDU93_003467 [Gonapodya sp. JEL0774]